MTKIVEQNRVRRMLQQRIGKHGIPVEMIEELTGISERRVRSHLANDGTKPNCDDMEAYCALFGPTFVDEWMAPYGMSGMYRAKAVEGCIFRNTLHAQTIVTDCLLTMSKATEDGKIDHNEKRIVPTVIWATTAHLNAVAAGYAGGLH